MYRNAQLRTRRLLVATLTAGVAPGSLAAEATELGRGAEVRFTVKVESSSGRVICALFDREGWLKKPVATASGSIARGAAECVFSGVENGTLGISAFDDQNDNGDLDTNWMGIPKEPWCASRNARGTFGPPAFDDASFKVAGGVLRLACRAR